MRRETCKFQKTRKVFFYSQIRHVDARTGQERAGTAYLSLTHTSMAAASSLVLPPPQSCKIFVYDSSARAAPFFAKHYHRRAPNYEADGFSTELWLQRTLLQKPDHPWRVSRAEDADFIFIAANLSLMCIAGKEWSARKFWASLRQDRRLWVDRGRAPQVPKVVSLQYRQNCRLPWCAWE